MGRPARPVMQRLMDAVTMTDSGCWEYNRGRTRGGYRQISIGNMNGRSIARAAHRVAYEHLVGPIPQGLQLDHLCRNRACVNPAHLEPVTPRENVRRAWRDLSACPAGHPYDADNTATYGGRSHVCRECNRTKARERYRALMGVKREDYRA